MNGDKRGGVENRSLKLGATLWSFHELTERNVVRKPRWTNNCNSDDHLKKKSTQGMPRNHLTGKSNQVQRFRELLFKEMIFETRNLLLRNRLTDGRTCFPGRHPTKDGINSFLGIFRLSNTQDPLIYNREYLLHEIYKKRLYGVNISQSMFCKRLFR